MRKQKPTMLDPTKYVWDIVGSTLYVRVGPDYVDSRVWVDREYSKYVVRFWEKLGKWTESPECSEFESLIEAQNFAEAGVAIGMDTAPLGEYRLLEDVNLENYFENLSSV